MSFDISTVSQALSYYYMQRNWRCDQAYLTPAQYVIVAAGLHGLKSPEGLWGETEQLKISMTGRWLVWEDKLEKTWRERRGYENKWDETE